MNAILGTEANVRILRVLAVATDPMSPVDVANRAMLNLSGALRALSSLEELGVVERVGVGRRQPFSLRRLHPLAPALDALFTAESARFQRILERLKAIIGQLSPPPKSAWIEGAFATQQDRSGDTLHLALLASAKDVTHAATTVSTESLPLQKELDVTIEVRGLTEPDLLAMPAKHAEQLRDVLPLFGPPPGFFLGGGKRLPSRRTHAEVDEDARALAAAVAAHLKRDPGIAKRAKAYVEERSRKASPAERHELLEWDAVLSTMTPARLRRFLVDPGERSTRLRQTMPFLAVLSPEERAAVYFDAARQRANSRKAP